MSILKIFPLKRLGTVLRTGKTLFIKIHVTFQKGIFITLFRPHRYFTDPDLLDRIPELFFVLAAIFIVMQIMAIVFLREPTEEELEELQPLTLR